MKIICESKLKMCLNKAWVDFYIIWRERKENHFHYILIFNAALLKMLRPSGVLNRDFNVFASKTIGATGWLTRRQKLLPNRVKCDIELSETSHEWAAGSKSTISAAKMEYMYTCSTLFTNNLFAPCHISIDFWQHLLQELHKRIWL